MVLLKVFSKSKLSIIVSSAGKHLTFRCQEKCMMFATDNLCQIHFSEVFYLYSHFLMLSAANTQLSKGVIPPSIVSIVDGLHKTVHSTCEDIDSMLDSHCLEFHWVVLLLASLHDPPTAGEVLAVSPNVNRVTREQQCMVGARDNFFELNVFLRLDGEIVDGEENGFLGNLPKEPLEYTFVDSCEVDHSVHLASKYTVSIASTNCVDGSLQLDRKRDCLVPISAKCTLVIASP